MEATPLADAYLTAIEGYVSAAEADLGAPVLAVALPVPPASDQGVNPQAPFVGELSTRVDATKKLNEALQVACDSSPVVFAGAEAWTFAQDTRGALREDMSDGHVHVTSTKCGTLHARVREAITRAIDRHRATCVTQATQRQ